MATAVAAVAVPAPVAAQQPKDVEVALVVPLSGPWARQGQLEPMGAEMAIDDINKSGGIKSLGGAKMKLILLDTGDSAERRPKTQRSVLLPRTRTSLAGSARGLARSR